VAIRQLKQVIAAIDSVQFCGVPWELHARSEMFRISIQKRRPWMVISYLVKGTNRRLESALRAFHTEGRLEGVRYVSPS
jgi:hypothetical protein